MNKTRNSRQTFASFMSMLLTLALCLSFIIPWVNVSANDPDNEYGHQTLAATLSKEIAFTGEPFTWSPAGNLIEVEYDEGLTLLESEGNAYTFVAEEPGEYSITYTFETGGDVNNVVGYEMMVYGAEDATDYVGGETGQYFSVFTGDAYQVKGSEGLTKQDYQRGTTENMFTFFSADKPGEYLIAVLGSDNDRVISVTVENSNAKHVIYADAGEEVGIGGYNASSFTPSDGLVTVSGNSSIENNGNTDADWNYTADELGIYTVTVTYWNGTTEDYTIIVGDLKVTEKTIETTVGEEFSIQAVGEKSSPQYNSEYIELTGIASAAGNYNEATGQYDADTNLWIYTASQPGIYSMTLEYNDGSFDVYTVYVDKATATAEPDACEHKWSEWEITKEPTETEDGEQQRTCEVCGELETEAIPASGSEEDSSTGSEFDEEDGSTGSGSTGGDSGSDDDKTDASGPSDEGLDTSDDGQDDESDSSGNSGAEDTDSSSDTTAENDAEENVKNADIEAVAGSTFEITIPSDSELILPDGIQIVSQTENEDGTTTYVLQADEAGEYVIQVQNADGTIDEYTVNVEEPETETNETTDEDAEDSEEESEDEDSTYSESEDADDETVVIADDGSDSGSYSSGSGSDGSDDYLYDGEGKGEDVQTGDTDMMYLLLVTAALLLAGGFALVPRKRKNK